MDWSSISSRWPPSWKSFECIGMHLPVLNQTFWSTYQSLITDLKYAKITWNIFAKEFGLDKHFKCSVVRILEGTYFSGKKHISGKHIFMEKHISFGEKNIFGSFGRFQKLWPKIDLVTFPPCISFENQKSGGKRSFFKINIWKLKFEFSK